MESLPVSAPVDPTGGIAGERAGYLFDPAADLLGKREAIGVNGGRIPGHDGGVKAGH
ncbi:hypothetical protein [Rhizorhabdus sp.]|uniref:hypothetical protein n=1 Tax=Rhizorhabdus sp. TaxID=1968843 RepID=UPI0035B3DD31